MATLHSEGTMAIRFSAGSQLVEVNWWTGIWLNIFGTTAMEANGMGHIGEASRNQFPVTQKQRNFCRLSNCTKNGTWSLPTVSKKTSYRLPTIVRWTVNLVIETPQLTHRRVRSSRCFGWIRWGETSSFHSSSTGRAQVQFPFATIWSNEIGADLRHMCLVQMDGWNDPDPACVCFGAIWPVEFGLLVLIIYIASYIVISYFIIWRHLMSWFIILHLAASYLATILQSYHPAACYIFHYPSHPFASVNLPLCPTIPCRPCRRHGLPNKNLVGGEKHGVFQFLPAITWKVDGATPRPKVVLVSTPCRHKAIITWEWQVSRYPPWN